MPRCIRWVLANYAPCCLCEKETASQVDIQGAPPILLARIKEWRTGDHTRIGDADVQSAQAFPRKGNGLLDRGFRGNIAGDVRREGGMQRTGDLLPLFL